jgi:hypothetical protein
LPDAGDAVRNGDTRQAGAKLEGPPPNAGYAIRDCDTRQAGAFEEGFIPDAGDRIAFNGVRND